MTTRSNLTRILETMALAARRSGRNPEEISLLAVSKRVDAGRIGEAAACGQCLFGENYLQEAENKIPLLPRTLAWHFIGHLQSNKAARAAELFAMVQTVDRLKIALALDAHATAMGRELPVLIQVNTGREAQKSGVLPEAAEALLEAVRGQTTLRVQGLMTMPPWSEDPEASRPYFRELRKLAERLAARRLFSDNARPLLSMGLSHDYPIAIEEGATMVRVGTALFGAREEAIPA